jgi:hypothetical protein
MTKISNKLFKFNFFLISLLPVFFFSRSTLINVVVILICTIYLFQILVNKNFVIYNNSIVIFFFFSLCLNKYFIQIWCY